MYYSETNPLKRVKYKKREELPVPKGERQRRLHKALLRYHDPENWPIIREALIGMGKKHLIGDKASCLVPLEDMESKTPAQRRKSGRHGSQRFATKHTKSQPGFEKLALKDKKNRNSNDTNQRKGKVSAGQSKKKKSPVN